jgi:hypothetical protein
MKAKKTTFEHLNRHHLLDNFKKALNEAGDSQEKLLNYLILNYVDQHLQVAHKLGFLTGLKTYTTYKLKISGGSDSEMQTLKLGLQDFVRENKIERAVEERRSEVSYLMDLNHDKHSKLAEWLHKNVKKVTMDFGEVTEIGADEKKLLLRRLKNGGNSGYERGGYQ